ncbi:MAG: tetratricopeptide repeat protein [Betaproteobacteria bacterium]
MKIWLAAAITAMLSACATLPDASRLDSLFRDDLFAAPSAPISADDVLALSGDMQNYLRAHLAGAARQKNRQRALIDALYSKDHLRLAYDATLTRNAAQTFSARAGNCLSLVIMTAAFAKSADVPVRYQMVLENTVWSRSGGMYFSISHVNIALGPESGARFIDNQAAPLTVDFLPGEDIRGQRIRVVSEQTIVAMYMNNRAAEALAAGQVDDAYGWARAAIKQDPRFLSAYNTLGVVYRHHGNPDAAERVLALVLQLEPGNLQAMSNLSMVYKDLGRAPEALALTRRLEELEPYPPFHFFELGIAAMRSGDYREAKALFEKEVERDAYYHEFRFWLGVAYLGLGDPAKARAQVGLALENSSTLAERELYAAKLDWMRSHRALPTGAAY